MKSAQEIVNYLAQMIGYVYERPLMYGENAGGVDLLLWSHHTTWAFIVGRQNDLRQVMDEILEREECGSANFSTRYARNHPSAADSEVTAYVVSQWSEISRRLGILAVAGHYDGV